ncbi:DUF4312 family protein [Enterobacteriaceae bacterium LUAb1]
MKETFTTTVTVSGKGEAKEKAFADALSRVQSAVLRRSGKILLRIAPQEVKVLHAEERVRNEKFLFFFLARERKHYSVELDVTVSVTCLDADQVDFTRV